jgi:hypothetical protein
LILAAVHVFDLTIGELEELGERRAGQAAQVIDERLPLGQPGGVQEIAEDDLVALAIKVDVAAGRQKRKAGFELPAQRTASTVDDRAQTPIEPELTR